MKHFNSFASPKWLKKFTSLASLVVGGGSPSRLSLTSPSMLSCGSTTSFIISSLSSALPLLQLHTVNRKILIHGHVLWQAMFEPIEPIPTVYYTR